MALIDESRQIRGQSRIIDSIAPSYFLIAEESGAVCINTTYTADYLAYLLPAITEDNVGIKFEFISTNTTKPIRVASINSPISDPIVYQDNIGNEVSVTHLKSGHTSLPVARYAVLKLQSVETISSTFVWVITSQMGIWSVY